MNRKTQLTRGMAALALTLAGGAQAAEPAWNKDYAAALTRAHATHKLVMVDFYTDWCTWCKRLDEDTYADAKVANQLSTAFVPVKVNAEKEGVEAAKQYGVNGFPTILFLNENGQVEGRIVGYAQPKEFGAKLTRIAAAHRDRPLLEAKYKADRHDLPTNARLAALYTTQADLPQAEARLAEAEASDPANAQGLLTPAYLALGDAYQENEDYAKATALFRKAAHSGKLPSEQASANFAIAGCYLAQRQPKPAIPYLKATVTTPGAPASLVATARRTLKQIRAQGLDK